MQDDLVPVRHVDHMVRHETNAHLMVNPGMRHADFLFSPQTQDKILEQFAEVRLAAGLTWSPGTVMLFSQFSP